MSNEIKEGFLEEQLSSKYKVTPEQLNEARKMNAKNRSGILGNLQQMGVLNEKMVIEIQVECFGTRVMALKDYPLKAELVQLFPEELRNKYLLIPIAQTGNILTVATSSIFQAQQISAELKKHTNCFVNFVLGYQSEIRTRLLEFTKPGENIDEMLSGRAKELSEGPELTQEKLVEDPHGPVAQAITYLVNLAVTTSTSDMHFEPLQASYRVRFRQDGVLRQIRTFEKVFTAPFAAAVKIMAGMDIAETRMPQDGTFRQTVAGRIVDFRVATYPAEFGEKIVIRILDSNKGTVSIDNLLLPPKEREKLVTMVEQPFGLIVCAGPTGSGKSTTLYSILAYLNSPEVNILTIEDPIEYRMGGITQAQVNTKKGFTFASGLRAMLRLDPNVILVGEMRDLETASIGVQAALTGHTVLSTVHANTATQTVSRFIDLGVEPFAIAAALQGVISQRLVRRLCEHCKEPTKEAEAVLLSTGFIPPFPENLFKSKGCKQCNDAGYRGRLVVQEILVIYNEMRPLIQNGASPGEIFKEARSRGLMTIRESAMLKIEQGLTTCEEVIRVLGVVEDEKAQEESDMKKAA